METILINYRSQEKRFAYLKDHRVERIMFDRPGQKSLVGNIYVGTVTKVLPGMNAVFVDIGEEKNAYLHRDVLPSYLLAADKQKNVASYAHQGEKLLVQVDKDATGTKGARLTGIIEIQGHALIYMPKGRYVAVSKKIADEEQKSMLRRLGSRLKTKEEGLIFRTLSSARTEEEMLAELQHLRDQYESILQMASTFKKPGVVFQKNTFMEMITERVARMKSGEVIVDDLSIKKLLEQTNTKVQITYYNGKANIFSANQVEHEIDKALKRIVWLDNGAYLIFDEAEALSIIDVNTGKFSGKADYEDTVLKTNQLAAKEIVRQLLLRDIGGIVLIDFIDMKREEDKQAVLAAVETELRKDEKRTKVIGFTPLGILQLTRKKTKISLSENLQVKCPVCDGTGRILSAETIAFRLERELLEHRHGDEEAILIETTQAVKEALLGREEAHRNVLEDLLQMKLYFSIKPAAAHYYLLKQFGTAVELAAKE